MRERDMANFRGLSSVIRGRLPSLRKAGVIPAIRIGPSDSVARPGRVALTVSVALAMCVIALAFAALWHEHEEKLARVQRDLDNLGHALAGHVARTLETIDLSLSAGLAQLRDAHGSPGASELGERALRAHADALPAVSAIALYAPDGARRAASTPGEAELPLRLPPSTLIAAQQKNTVQGLSVFSQHMDAAGTLKLIVTRAVPGPEAESRGVIAAAVDARRLAGPYRAINFGESASVALYSARGVLLASHPWREDLIGRQHDGIAPPADNAAKHVAAGQSIVSPFSNQPAIAANVPIYGYPLTLSLTIDRAAALAPWRRQALVVGAAAAMIATLTLALGALAERHLRRREQSIAELRENQAELTEAHRIAQLGRFSFDGATATFQWSAQAAQLLGMPSALSSSLEQLIAQVVEEDREMLRSAWARLIAGTGGDDIEFRIAAPEAHLRWLRARAELLPVRDGESIRARGTLIDITERKRVETAQEHSDERVRRITANLPGIVFEYRMRPDRSATFEYVSDRALDVLEESPASLMREPRLMFELVDPAYRRRLLRSMRASGENLTLWTFELPIRTRSGRVKWVRGQSVPKRHDDGSVTWDGVIVDVSTQKQAEQAIQTSNERLERRVAERTAELSAAYRELESFSYSVSHDLRAPLRAIDGFSRILLDDHAARLEPDAVQLLDRVRAAASRMGQLIDDLLSLSRVTRSEPKRIRTDLSAIAQAIADELMHESPQRNVDIRIEPAIACCADPNLMRIALANLIGNAWKFSSKRDRAIIEFGSLRNGEKTVYYVRDNGAGFDMKYAGKLFGAFQRVHSSCEFDGTGIGLATVSRIVDRHGGAVWAQAEVNQGATFYFTLSGSGER